MRSSTISAGRSSRAIASAFAPSFAKSGTKPASFSLKPSTSSASGSSSTTRIFDFIFRAGVADVLCLVQIDDFLRDVGRVVGDALDGLGDHHEVEAAGDGRRT